MPNVTSAPSDSKTNLDQARSELRKRLAAGLACRAEDILSSYPDLSSDADSAIELIVEEYRLRRELGLVVNPQEWLERFPEYRGRLETLLGGVDTSGAVDAGLQITLKEATLPADVERVAAPQAPALRMLGHHELLEEIGRGGMGVVYKARHTILDRTFALKMIASGGAAGMDEVRRFLREARAASALDHPNIVRIFEIGCEDYQHYFTMAYVPGGSLADCKDQFSDPPAAAALVAKLARAVQYAHDKGIIHRDLKPANVLLDEDRQPKITDFGLAKLINTPTDLTQAGSAMGTPSYMSPEQADGRTDRISPQTDVWALGVILYELLTGRQPFSGKSADAVKAKILHREPRVPCALKPELDRKLEAIVLKCLEKEPERRYSTAANLADDLERWGRREPTAVLPESRVHRIWKRLRRRPPATVISGALVLCIAVLLLGGGALTYKQQHQTEDPQARELRLLKQEIDDGKTVELLRDDGLPRWSHPRFGGDDMTLAGARDGLSMESSNHSVLELYPDLPASFTLSAKVQFVKKEAGSEAGLCVGFADRPGPDGQEFYFATVVLTDEPNGAAPADGDPLLNRAVFRVRRYCPAEENRPVNASGPVTLRIPVRRFDAAVVPVELTNEHLLKLVVTAENIQGFLDDRGLGVVTWKQLDQDSRKWLGMDLILPQGLPKLPPPQPNARPLHYQCIASLFVVESTALFRDVSIGANLAQP